MTFKFNAKHMHISKADNHTSYVKITVIMCLGKNFNDVLLIC